MRTLDRFNVGDVVTHKIYGGRFIVVDPPSTRPRPGEIDTSGLIWIYIEYIYGSSDEFDHVLVQMMEFCNRGYISVCKSNIVMLKKHQKECVL